jgi:hypothetical protein
VGSRVGEEIGFHLLLVSPPPRGARDTREGGLTVSEIAAELGVGEARRRCTGISHGTAAGSPRRRATRLRSYRLGVTGRASSASPVRRPSAAPVGRAQPGASGVPIARGALAEQLGRDGGGSELSERLAKRMVVEVVDLPS